jgi:hypothetical protein
LEKAERQAVNTELDELKAMLLSMSRTRNTGAPPGEGDPDITEEFDKLYVGIRADGEQAMECQANQDSAYVLELLAEG